MRQAAGNGARWYLETPDPQDAEGDPGRNVALDDGVAKIRGRLVEFRGEGEQKKDLGT